MLRVGPDLLFTSQEACQQRSPALEGQPQDAVGHDATPTTNWVATIGHPACPTFARVAGAKPSAVSAVGYRPANSVTAARRTGAAFGADHFRLAHLRFRL
jgi:hypothetical protein